jgi:hypothetical protein
MQLTRISILFLHSNYKARRRIYGPVLVVASSSSFFVNFFHTQFVTCLFHFCSDLLQKYVNQVKKRTTVDPPTS